MAKKETLPCSDPDCDKKVPSANMIHCDDCGAPTCGKHDTCWLCDDLDSVEPTCEKCEKKVDDWDDLQMPYCPAHTGGCYELFICDDCYDDWECPKKGQYELNIPSVGGLPF